jgi:hypothetical protein
MASPLPRRFHPVTLQQAAEESPTLAALAQRARESSERLQAVQSLIPPALRPAVKAGPIEGAQWCLLVQGNAAAAKLRQLLPMLTGRLKEQGWAVETIRLKVQA